jgi:peptide/nickel transport system permease protein
MVGLTLILFMMAIAVLAPVLAPPFDEDEPYLVPKDHQLPKPPGTEGMLNGQPITHFLGTGKGGEDIYYGVIWGARTSLFIAIAVVGSAALIGIAIGAVAGYYGRWADEALMRLTDAFMSLPSLILAMAVIAVMSRGTEAIIIALIITWWPAYARLVRGQVLSVKTTTYVEAAMALGARRRRVLFRHILPNSLGPLIVQITLDMGIVVLVAAGLSYIGFSQPNLAEWGRMVADGQGYVFAQVPYPFPDGPVYNPWWTWLFPGMFICVFVLGFNLLGDGLRDLMDPRGRRHDHGDR